MPIVSVAKKMQLNKLYRQWKLDRPPPGDLARVRSFFDSSMLVFQVTPWTQWREKLKKGLVYPTAGPADDLSCNQHLIYAGRRARSADPMRRPYCTD
jgi:hypothetical protein